MVPDKCSWRRCVQVDRAYHRPVPQHGEGQCAPHGTLGRGFGEQSPLFLVQRVGLVLHDLLSVGALNTWTTRYVLDGVEGRNITGGSDQGEGEPVVEPGNADANKI